MNNDFTISQPVLMVDRMYFCVPKEWSQDWTYDMNLEEALSLLELQKQRIYLHYCFYGTSQFIVWLIHYNHVHAKNSLNTMRWFMVFWSHNRRSWVPLKHCEIWRFNLCPFFSQHTLATLLAFPRTHPFAKVLHLWFLLNRCSAVELTKLL